MKIGMILPDNYMVTKKAILYIYISVTFCCGIFLDCIFQNSQEMQKAIDSDTYFYIELDSAKSAFLKSPTMGNYDDVYKLYMFYDNGMFAAESSIYSIVMLKSYQKNKIINNIISTISNTSNFVATDSITLNLLKRYENYK